MNVQVVTLVSGDVLVGDVSERLEDTSRIILDAPLRLVVTQTEASSMNIGLLPAFPLSTQKSFSIPKTSILVMYAPTLELQNQWTTHSGRGVLVPENSGLKLVR